jgi:hypothetical protein
VTSDGPVAEVTIAPTPGGLVIAYARYFYSPLAIPLPPHSYLYAVGVDRSLRPTGQRKLVSPLEFGLYSYRMDRILSIASRGSTIYAAWLGGTRPEDHHVRGSLLSDDGTVLQAGAIPGVPISRAAAGQLRPRATSHAGMFVSAWAETRDMQPTVVVGRFHSDGTPLDPEGIALSPGSLGTSVESVVSDGKNFLVLWKASDLGANPGIFAARVSPLGEILDAEPIVVSPSPGYAAVAHGHGGYGIVWTEQLSGGGALLRSARLSESGAVGTPTTLATLGSSQSVPMIASIESGFFVVSGSLDFPTLAPVYGLLLDDDARPRTTERRLLFQAVREFRLASDGHEALVVGSGQVNSFDPVERFRARRIGPGGTVDPVVDTGIRHFYGGLGDLQRVGDSYLLSWRGPLTSSEQAATRLARLGRRGQLLEAPIELPWQDIPSVASTSENRTMLVYVRPRPEHPFYGVHRAAGRFILLDSIPERVRPTRR